MNYLLKTINTRKSYFSLFSGLFFATIFSLGNSFYNFEGFNFDLAFFIKLALSFLLFSGLSYLFLDYLDKYRNKEINEKVDNYPLSFWQIWLLILLPWVPAFLSFYPGIVAYDTLAQLAQIFGALEFNNYNPIIHTFIIQIFFKIGQFFNNYSFGIALYSIFQMICLSLVFTWAVLTIKNLINNKYFVYLSIGFFALFPVNHIFSINMTKDVFFTAIFLSCFLMLVKIFTYKEIIYSYKYFIYLGILFSLLSLFRANGLLVFILLIPILLMNKKYRFKFIISILLGIIFYTIILGSLFSNFDVHDEQTVEAHSVFLQQMTRSLIKNPSSFTQKNIDDYYFLLKDDVLEKYKYGISDPVKKSLNKENITNVNKQIFPLWYKIGLKNPYIYTESFLLGNYSYWYPNARYPIPGADGEGNTAYHAYIETVWHREYHKIDVIEEPIIYDLRKFYTYIGSNEIQKDNIFLSLLFSPGFYMWIVFLVFIKLWYFREYNLLLPIFIILALFTTILLGPIALIRYIYPIMVCIPVIITLLFISKDK